MVDGPSPALLKDPRFEAVVTKAAKRQGLSGTYVDTVRQLVCGSADPRSFPCCDTGCQPCSKDFLRAAEEVLKTLHNPATVNLPWWRRLLGRS
jgi:hypothetical protein